MSRVVAPRFVEILSPFLVFLVVLPTIVDRMIPVALFLFLPAIVDRFVRVPTNPMTSHRLVLYVATCTRVAMPADSVVAFAATHAAIPIPVRRPVSFLAMHAIIPIPVRCLVSFVAMHAVVPIPVRSVAFAATPRREPGLRPKRRRG